MGEELAVAHMKRFASHKIAFANEVGCEVIVSFCLSSRADPFLPSLLFLWRIMEPCLLCVIQAAVQLHIPKSMRFIVSKTKSTHVMLSFLLASRTYP